MFDTCSSSPAVVFRWWSELASGVSSSLGGTSCQNIPRYLSHSSIIAAPLLLPVFSCFLHKNGSKIENPIHLIRVGMKRKKRKERVSYHMRLDQALELCLSHW